MKESIGRVGKASVQDDKVHVPSSSGLFSLVPVAALLVALMTGVTCPAVAQAAAAAGSTQPTSRPSRNFTRPPVPARAAPGNAPAPSVRPPGTLADSIEFKRLTPDAATAMAISEDGKSLFTAHADLNQVRIWNVETGETVAVTGVDSPRALLSRGQELYVVSYKTPAVSVLAANNQWGVKREIKIGLPQPFYLSAPQGKAFAGKALVTCLGRAGNTVIEVALTGGGGWRTLTNVETGIATCDAPGERVLVQQSHPQQNILICNYAEFLRGKKDLNSRSLPDAEFRYQVRDSDRWYGGRTPANGSGDAAGGTNPGTLCVPDTVIDYYYALTAMYLSARPRGPGAINDHRRVSLPESGQKLFEQSKWKPFCKVNAQFGSVPDPLSPPAAVTLGDKLYFFVFSQSDGAVYRGVTARFGDVDKSNVPVPPQDGDLPVSTNVVEEVKAASGIRAFCISEDGTTLVASREGMLLVWDLRTGKLTKRIPSKYVTSILWRRGTVYAADLNNGTLETFEPNMNWRAGYVYKLPAQPSSIAAARGKAFDGKILMLGNSAEAWIIDTATHSTKLLYKLRELKGLTLSCDGATVVEQSQQGTPEQFDFATYRAGKTPVARTRTGFTNVGRLFQNRPGPLWFEQSRIFSGTPINEHSGGRPMGVLVPDISRDMFYELAEKQLRFYKLDLSLTKIGSRDVGCADRLVGELFGEGFRTGNYGFFSQPQAAVVGDRLYVLVLDGQGHFYYLNTAAAVDAKEVAGAIPPGTFPRQVTEGKPVRFKIDAGGPQAQYAVVTGPAGISIDKDGLLTWTPVKGVEASVTIKIRVEVGGKTSFVRYETEVISGAAVGKAGNAPATTGEAGRHYLMPGPVEIAAGNNNSSVLLHQDNVLRILDGDGVTQRATHTLDRKYRWVHERADYFVAVSDDVVDILDKSTLRKRRTIPIDPPGVQSAAFHPKRGQTYLARSGDADRGTRDIFGNGRPVLVIEEAAGKAVPIPHLFAAVVAVHPSGRSLYVAFPPMAIDPSTGKSSPELSRGLGLLNLDVSPPAVVAMRPAEDSVLTMITDLRVSPEGGAVCRLPGQPKSDRHPAGNLILSALDITSPALAFYGGNATFDLSFHPFLNLAATVETGEYMPGRGGNGKLVIRQARSGAVSERRLDIAESTLQSVQRAWFAPGGRHLLVAHTGSDGRQVLEAFKLRLSPEEEQIVSGGLAGRIVQPVFADRPATRPSRPVTTADIDALLPTRQKLAGPKEIATACPDSVLLVKTSEGSGTGWVVGRKGLVLTCAHVLSDVGAPIIVCKMQQGAAAVEKEVPAVILRVDRNRDLALLQIAVPGDLKPLHLAAGDTVAMGEAVSVLAHPGSGTGVLTHTLTTGIVSHPDRRPLHVSYIQTTATVNPGSSGGPLFNSEGSVIGVINSKAVRLESTAYAIALKEVRAFLVGCTEAGKR